MPRKPNPNVQQGKQQYANMVLWVLEHIADKQIPQNEPVPGAIAMLQWAQSHQHAFFNNILPKAYQANPENETQKKHFDDLDHVKELYDKLNLKRLQLKDQKGNSHKPTTPKPKRKPRTHQQKEKSL